MATSAIERRSTHGKAGSGRHAGRGSGPSGFGARSGLLQPLNPKVALAVAMVIAGGWGLVAGWWIPRGPLTSTETLITMVGGLTVGLLGGWITRMRWAMLICPVAFVVVFEVVRFGLEGPTVDGFHLSTYGVLALMVGRGFHGWVGLLPMVLGAAIGAGTARRAAGHARLAWGGYLRRGMTVLVALGVVGLAVLVARPVSTAPIVDADGQPLAGSVAELTTVNAGGHELGLMVRGVNADNPVLLFLAGGPGGSERGAMRNHLQGLEQSFVVATWDQRGTGTSYAELDPASTHTLDSYVADTLAVTNYLRDRFGQEKIYLVGQSWGSILGVLAVQEAPELYEAFIGTGQMVSVLETDRIFYEDTLDWATQNGDTPLARQLTEIGPPPYDRMLDYETALSYEHEVYPYDHSGNSEGAGGFSENFIVPEYSFTDQVHLLGAFMDTFSVLYPQLQDIDFRETAGELQVPVYIVQGANEADGRSEPFDEWYRTLDAPSKDLVVLETSGHRPPFEQPAEFVDYLENTVLAGSSGN